MRARLIAWIRDYVDTSGGWGWALALPVITIIWFWLFFSLLIIAFTTQP